MIATNEYFDANVKSLAYENAKGKSTIGVMEPGAYKFGTATHETMTVIEGELIVLLPGETEEKSITNGDVFEVAADFSFKVRVIGQTSYLCQYK